ncbi:fibrocystin-L-like [Saccostrea echinata]|uniref:fibrocystin-L-like n=1 Tax=Saccostrea echinata TaxID=191078 RepID=UPI002A82FAE0|nr:fibrocystin-L-like [Saccostrea echinata]
MEVCSVVSRVTPNHGSLCGETRLLITGTGFSKDNINEGNKVRLVSSSMSYDCPVLKDGTTEEDITCYTVPGMKQDNYYVRLNVDGKDVPVNSHCRYPTDWRCRVTIRSHNTPTITSVEPSSGPPESIIKISGRIITDRFDTNVEKAMNGRTEKIARVYAGPQLCSLKAENDAFYGKAMNSENTWDWNGYMKCKMNGKFVGNQNVSYIISGSFGRSCRPNTLFLSRTKQLYLFQTYAEVTSVSPSVGSIHGDTMVTITGKNFDQTRSPAKVKISGQNCEVKSVTATQITCKTPPKPGTSYTKFPGNRGLWLEVWNRTSRHLDRLDEVLTFNESYNDYSRSHIDNTDFDYNLHDNYVNRLSGFFIPPWSGHYSFAIRADDVGQLYFSNTSNPEDMEKIAECKRYTTKFTRWPEQLSKKFTLKAGEAYYMVILHRDYSGPERIRVAARFYQTDLTNQSTAYAEQEHQKIEVRSTVVREVQNISLVTESAGAGVNEVQKVQICDTAQSGAQLMFRMGFYNVYTDILTSQSSISEIKNALKSLPIFDSHESVNVINKTESSGCLIMFVEFISKRGNFEDLKVVMKSTGIAVNISVEEVQAGKPTGEYIAFSMAGVISPLFSGKPTKSQMDNGLGQIFASRCPNALGNPTSKAIHHGFESDVLPSGMSVGTIVSDVEAFCGKKCVKNPNFLYYDKNNPISLGQSVKVVCFAYFGKLQNFFKLGYTYKNSKGVTVNDQYAYPSTTFRQSPEWNYKCIDMLAVVQDGKVGTSFKIFLIEIRKDDSEDFYYVDEIYVGRNPTNLDEENINLMRLRPAMPGGGMISHVNVIRSDKNDTAEYQVEFIPYACAYNFSLLAAVPGQISSGTILSISRVSAASPPVSGNFSVTFQNKTLDGIPFTIDGTRLAAFLQSGIPEMGNLYTYKHGGCAAFDLNIGFHSRGGDQETIQVTSYAEGENVTAIVNTVTDGNVWMNPIPGDMLATLEKKPSVMAYINDIPTKCSGNCSWEWSELVTPIIVSVTPNTGFPTSTLITINGTGFHGNHSLNSVMIGGVPCVTVTSNSTEIVCRVGDGPTGTYPVMVNVAGLGKAENTNNSVTFSYQFSIQSMVPTSVSLGGGLNLTLGGYGFSSKDEVYVGDVMCPKLSSTSTQTVCLIPPSSEGKNASIVVKQGYTGINVTHSKSLMYSSTDMIIVNSVEPNSTFVAGWTEITIQGEGLNQTESVTIGDKPVSPTNSSDTEIKLIVPSMPAGAYPIKLLGATGFAVDSSTNSLPSMEWRLIVSSVAPLMGSLRGGTTLTIMGDGFSTNKSRNSVMVGTHICDIQSSTITELKCQIADTAKVHSVDNSGVHPSFKLSGYAWNPQYLTVNVGDTVEWTWSFASYISGMRPRVVQVKDESSVEEVEGGFNSGEPKEAGVFRHQFTVPGKYCYWSDYIDQYKTTWFRGCITVEDLSSNVAEVIVKVNGYEALYQKVAPSAPLPAGAPGGVCTGDSTPLSNCSVPQPTGGDPTKFNFKFWTCTTPVVTALSENNGTVNTNITLQGTGFSNNDCQNEISFGDGRCVGDKDSGTDVICNIDDANSPSIGVLQPVTVRHNNLGYALVAITGVKSRSFALIPVVTKVMPSVGSLVGGLLVQIQGFGFSTMKDYVSVTIGGYTCDITNMTYTEISCRTRAGQGEKNLEVRVRSSQGQWFPAVCEDECKFTYDAAFTPSLTSISPNVVNGTKETTVTIEGSGFGNETSDIFVKIGGENCQVVSVSNSSVECMLGNLPAGPNNLVVVEVVGQGLASGNLMMTGAGIITDISPTEGSIHGGTIVLISGNGFVDKLTSVTVKGKPCPIVNLTLSTISCITPSTDNEEIVEVRVISNQISYPAVNFNYSYQASPNISYISPTNGSAGTEVTIAGVNFDRQKEKITVNIGSAECSVISSSETEIKCTAGPSLVGSFPVLVNVQGKGQSNQNSEFEYELLVTSISPNTGGIAGDQLVTVSGSGFDNNTSVWICDRRCESVNQSASQYKCRTPVPADGNLTCTVNVTNNGVTRTLRDAYTYDAALTANVTMVTPARGGTAGGTTLTIEGTGFGSVKADVSVSIAGTVCDVKTVTPTQITCVTNQHPRSQKALIRVEVAGNGKAVQTSAEFFYIDVWSSPFTWGGGPLPKEDDFVVITAGQTILLDVSTPKLRVLLIQGGTLVFDDKDLELKAVNILIVQNGLLQVGTKEKPFQHKAEITLYGNHRTKEYPIYGTKSLAVREGNLELHGKPVPVPWTTLETTALAGNSTIVLREAVTWKAGDKIVIATTSHRHSQKETELRIIQSVDSDNRTITLTEPLKYDHLGVTETFDGTDVDFRAEVGMLSRNIIVRGDSNSEFVEKIEACPDGFDTGEFATQTCFQGRFGEEMGSDQFGAQIMIHSPKQSGSMSHARLEYVEVTHAGQAFRLGRYPIHFHLNGDTNGSYVRGCGIYNTFNRAVNIHGSHNVLVEHNVAYNVMGGAFFFEDGIETGSTVQYNLLMFVRESSSLQNDDVTPAAYWVTNPDNTIQHNRAVGGTHFGFWYRMHTHPDGPSFDSSICPQHIPVRAFRNNTAHSNGWFGLWIFTTIKTREGGGCSSTKPAMSLFESLTAWNNEKGAEIVNGGALECRDFVLVNNKLAGYEGKLIIEGDQLFKNLLIVGHASSLTREEQGCTRAAFVLPYGNGMTIDGIRFVNFDESNCVGFDFARIAGTCAVHCGGFYYETRNLKWVSAPNKGTFPWPWAGIIRDLDGTLIGETGNAASIAANAGKSVSSASDTLPPTCVSFAKFSSNLSGSIPAKACPPEVKYHRFSFNGISPEALNYKDFVIVNRHGNDSMPWRKKAITHKLGWMTVLLDGEEYFYYFKDADQLTNISYTGTFDRFQKNSTGGYEYVIMRQKVSARPDRFMLDGSTNIEPTRNIDGNTVHGQWEYLKNDNEIRYILSSRKATSRRKRSVDDDITYSVSFRAFKCFYLDCKAPVDPNTVPPVTSRPYDFEYWSDKETWKNAEMGWGGYISNGTYDLPKDGDNVKINKDQWVVADTDLPAMGKLVLFGTLELDDANGTRNFVLNCTYIVILGGRLIIGWPDKPFLGRALILLNGEHSTPPYPMNSGPQVGSKAIGTFGGLDLHGRDVGTSWTMLGVTANPGDNQISLVSSVTWKVGSEIVIAPTDFSVWETETFAVTAVSSNGRTLTLNSTLKYKHIAHTETAGNKSMTMAAEVGLLTRNIRVEGATYDKLYKESFGARIVVGRTQDPNNTNLLYIGFARISNVEFYHSGQEGWVEPFDPRGSIAYVDAGTVSSIKPSYVKKCAFHKGFSPAIMAYGTNNLPIEDNVIADTVWFAVESMSDSTIIRNNFVTKVQWEGSYQDRKETSNFRFNGAFNLHKATNLILQDNHVGGAERLGFRTTGEPCDVSAINPWRGNVVHTALVGVGLLPIDPLPDYLKQCVKYSFFTLWKNLDYGIFYIGPASSSVENLKAADNGVSVFQFVMGPASLGHNYANKYAKVKDSLIIGTSDELNCATALGDKTDDNIAIGQEKMQFHSSPIRVGVTMPTFSSGSNACPNMPCSGIMSYQAIKGICHLQDVTFSKFSNKCNSEGDRAVAPNKKNDDGNHPFITERIQFYNVEEDNKIIFWRSDIGKINSADCVDMACDAKVKCLLQDLDGTFLNSSGFIIPQSEYEWGGNPKMGLGDYRIPKEMLVRSNGSRIPVNEIAPHKGIIRSNCQYRAAWQAYECHDLNYKSLVIESMDADTETRRLSPVAILGGGYLDLINGPQDHGWCSGYTCRKRLSTFQAIVATEKEFLLHYTSVSPQKSRFFLLDAKPNDCISLSIWYSQPWRLDVYHNGEFIMPPNARYAGIDKRYVVDPPPIGQPDFYKPNVTGCQQKSGLSYFNRDSGIITLLIKGPDPVEIITVKTVMVSFQIPAMPADEFYGDRIVMNLASFLNIDASRVRITNIVRETSSSRGRRKRSTDVVTGVEIEISNPPSQEVNSTADAGDLSSGELQNITTTIVNEVQLGTTLRSLVNITGASISEPPPDPTDPNWQKMAEETNEERYQELVQPNLMRLYTPVIPIHEGAPFSSQPKLQVYDANGNVVNKLGTNVNPWEITATLRNGTGDPAAQLLGERTAKYNNGWANFTDLAISHMGSGYIIDFVVTYPVVASFSLSSSNISVTRRSIVVDIVNITSDPLENSYMTVDLELRDKVTSQVIKQVNWRNHKWIVNIELGGQDYYRGQLSGNTTTTFDDNSGMATLSNFSFNVQGMVVMKIIVTSEPPEYTLELETLIHIQKLQQISFFKNSSQDIQLRFEANYDTVVGTRYLLHFQAMMGNFLSGLYPDIVLNSIKIRKGSILVTFQVSGTSTMLNTTVSSLCSAVENGTNFNFRGTSLTLANYLSVDGEDYYGTKCAVVEEVKPPGKEKDVFTMGIYIALALVGTALVVMIIAVVFWKMKVVPKSQTHCITSPEYFGKSESVEILKTDKIDDSVLCFENESYEEVPPADTSFSTFTRNSASSDTKSEIEK